MALGDLDQHLGLPGGQAVVDRLGGIVLAAHNLSTLLRRARTTGWTHDPLTRVVPERGDVFDPDPGTGASAPTQPGAPPLAA